MKGSLGLHRALSSPHSGKQSASLIVSVVNCQLGSLRSIVSPLWGSVSPPRSKGKGLGGRLRSLPGLTPDDLLT